MDLEKKWNRALAGTEIIRSRVSYLATFEATVIPYILLAESKVNLGDTILRRGRIKIQRPEIVLPEDSPQFKGFEFEKDYHVGNEGMKMFFMVRGVNFPSLKYKHEIAKLDIYEGHLSKARKHFKDELEKTEDVKTGLIVGPEDVWQFCLLVYVGLLVSRSSSSDFRRLWEKFKDKFR